MLWTKVSDYWNHFVIVLFFNLKGLTILGTTVFATPGYREACNDLEFLSSFERLDRQALCDRHLVRILGLENSSNASEVWPQNLRYHLVERDVQLRFIPILR